MKTKNILVAFDKFKGSLTSNEACEIAKNTLLLIDSTLNITICPLADGGEGSLECFIFNQKANLVTDVFLDANFNPIQASYAIKDDIALIELAKTAGLGITKIKNPLETSTIGVGQQIKHAIDHGAKKIYLALGGSSTNDAGCGLAVGLGFQFFDKNHQSFIPTGKNLDQIVSFQAVDLKDIDFYILCDVDNPLYGNSGAAKMYAKQKGANDQQIKFLNNQLKSFNRLGQKFNFQLQKTKGSGAAGGCAAGCLLFLNAKILSGAKTFLHFSGINDSKHYDYIITGEGQIDAQSKHQKLVYTLYNIFKNQNFVAFCGQNFSKFTPFSVIEINKKEETLEQSINHSAKNLAQAIHFYFTQYL